MFNLLRYFSVASLCSILVASIGLSFLYREFALRDLLRSGEKHNEILTHVITNAISPELKPFLITAAALTADEIQRHEETARLHERLRAITVGTSLLKIKIYSLDGRTVYSSEARQIGEDKRLNAGFIAARAGSPITEITHRDKFSAFEETVVDRGVLSSYAPIRWSRSERIDGVLEVYDDVTPLLGAIKQTQQQVIFGVLTVLALLYAVLFFIARHANRIIKQQAAGQTATEARLSEQLERVRAAEARSRLLASMVEQTRDAMLARDMEGTIIAWNAAAGALYGYTADEAIGQPTGTLYQAGMSPEEHDAVRERIRSGERHDLETKRTDRSGRTIDVWITTSPLTDADGRQLGVIAVMRDISEHKRLEREMGQARATAEAANRAKSEFLANMSHEIRTPLNGVLGMTELVLATDLTPEQREHLTLASASGTALLQVLNDVLDFSKIEAGHLEVEAIDFAPAQCVAEVVRMLGHGARQKGLALEWHTLRNTPERVIGDPGRIRQILVNLIGNAIKFTAQGQVEILLGASEHTDTSVLLSIAVQDSGIGIAADKQPAIFDAFTQVDSSTSRRYGGTGLGLAITWRLVTLMGGRIWVESTLGKGSTFVVTLRCGIATSEPGGPSQERAANGSPDNASIHAGAPRSILLVEDNAINQRVATRMIERIGHRVVVAADGVAAIAALKDQHFDLVLMDMQMPIMDGLEATKVIRENEQSERMPIIALTANALAGDRERCIDAGMDD